jgi:hypothetical protein
MSCATAVEHWTFKAGFVFFAANSMFAEHSLPSGTVLCYLIEVAHDQQQ